ncbi:MAG: TetR/AcrR family transcriptional regulator [Rhodoferax sp.]|nr:TetR/AcrR family transcriptional regulator [Rhodoferax sp.]
MTYEPKTKPKRVMHHRTASGQAQKAKTRELIIQSAIPVFAKHGPDSPVIDDFVQAAGISRGTFYNYFQTTRELLDAAMARLSDEVIATIVPVVEGEPNPVIRFASAARMYYRKATLDPLFGQFLGSVSSVGALAMEHAHADLQEAMQAGFFKIQDMDLAEAVAFGVMVFSLRTAKAREGGDARALEVVRAILSALGVDPTMIDLALSVPLPPFALREIPI